MGAHVNHSDEPSKAASTPGAAADIPADKSKSEDSSPATLAAPTESTPEAAVESPESPARTSDAPPHEAMPEPSPENTEGAASEAVPEPIPQTPPEPVSEPFSEATPKVETAQFEGNEPFIPPEAPLAGEGEVPESASTQSTEPSEAPDSATAPAPAPNPVPPTEPVQPQPIEPDSTPEPSHAGSGLGTSNTEAPSPTPASSSQAPTSTPSPASSGIVGLILAKARAIKQLRRQKKLLKIMTLFARKETITNDDVERMLRVSDATATRYLSELEAIGKIVQVGKTGRGVEYRAK